MLLYVPDGYLSGYFLHGLALSAQPVDLKVPESVDAFTFVVNWRPSRKNDITDLFANLYIISTTKPQLFMQHDDPIQ